MKVKIDTKEKFSVLTIQDPVLSANMTEELNQELLSFPEADKKNIVLNMSEVDQIDEIVASSLQSIRQKFYTANASFVLCEVKPSVQECFAKLNLLEAMNITPTESEAWDIVQLEEIERELM